MGPRFISVRVDLELHDRFQRAEARRLAAGAAWSMFDRAREAIVRACEEVEATIGDDPLPPLDISRTGLSVWPTVVARWVIESLVVQVPGFSARYVNADLDVRRVTAADIVGCLPSTLADGAGLEVATRDVLDGCQRRSPELAMAALPTFCRLVYGHTETAEVLKGKQAPALRCPHDGAWCHHNCERGCFREERGMSLSTPWSGYPLPGHTAVFPSSGPAASEESDCPRCGRTFPVKR